MSTPENEFVKCAEGLGFPIRDSQGSTYIVMGDPDYNQNWHKPDRESVQKLLMLEVIEKCKWDMVAGEYADYGKENWGVLTDDIENPIIVHQFSDLPLAVCKAFNEEKGILMQINDNDRKLAELINEEWAWVVPPNSWGGYHTPSENGVPLPFSTDPAAAWRLIEHIGDVRFSHGPQNWICQVYKGEWHTGVDKNKKTALVQAAINSLEEK